jgi:hypothetical protein
MSIGNDIDSNLEAIKIAKNRIKNSETKRNDYLKKLFETMEEICKQSEEVYYMFTFGDISISFMIDSHLTIRKTIVETEKHLFRTISTNKEIQAQIDCLSERNNQFHHGKRVFNMNGDQILFDEFVANYGNIILELTNKIKLENESEADKIESQNEIGILNDA